MRDHLHTCLLCRGGGVKRQMPPPSRWPEICGVPTSVSPPVSAKSDRQTMYPPEMMASELPAHALLPYLDFWFCGADWNQDLPKDPRCWSRGDVARWLEVVAAHHSLPAVRPERFLMNGKALCLMTMDMFVSRVPLGGKLLYKDFQLRLSSALYS